MNKVIDFDERSMTVTVEAGMIFGRLEWYANERGYSLMHYPSSINCGTVGGFLAHNGIGVLSTKYGKIDDQCLSLEVVVRMVRFCRPAPCPSTPRGPACWGCS